MRGELSFVFGLVSNEENQFSIVCYIKNHSVSKKKE